MADLLINLRCATGLKKVNLLSKMGIYARVSISGAKHDSKIKTPTDHDGGSNPTWDFPITFAMEEEALHQDRLTLQFDLVCERALGDKDVGRVRVSVKDLLDSPATTGGVGWRFVSYQVTKPSGRPKGHITFSYKFRRGSDDETSGATAAKVDSDSDSDSKSNCVAKGEGLKMYPTVEFDFNSVYPPVWKIYETEVNSVYPPAELDVKGGVYPPPAKLDVKGGVYPPRAKMYPELRMDLLKPEIPFVYRRRYTFPEDNYAYPPSRQNKFGMQLPATTADLLA